MRLRRSQGVPCRLARGEIRRVPKDSRSLLGYYVACMRCGFVSVAIQGDKGLMITEGDAEDDVSLSSPMRCTYCQVLIHVSHGEATLEEDADVRPVQYR